MRASLGGRSELASRVQLALMLPTKKQAEQIVDVVIGSLEQTLLNNLAVDGFTLNWAASESSRSGTSAGFSEKFRSLVRRS